MRFRFFVFRLGLSSSEQPLTNHCLLKSDHSSALATLIAVTACTLTMLFSACSRPAEQVFELSGSTMGTTYSVKITSIPDRLSLVMLSRLIDQRLARVNNLMSTYQPDSELSRFNAQRSTDWFSVSPELVQVIARAQAISELSGGAFDVTVGPVVNLWGFGPDVTKPEVPDDRLIDSARARIGYRMLEYRTSPAALRKARPDLYVDLSAIAKGYGVDQIAAALEDNEIDAYLVEIGGELRGKGTKRHGKPWHVAIERPDPLARSVYRVIQLSDAALATSGDYRNFFEDGGHLYSHTIDPQSGRPVEHGLASVTVLSDDCTNADALATALLVMGPERGFALAESRDIAAFFVTRTTEGYANKATPAFGRVLSPES